MVEQPLFQRFRYRRRPQILRFGNVYGPFSTHKVGVINRWIRALLEDKDIIIYGDGSASRDYIHVDDLTDGLLLSLKRLLLFISPTVETYHLANHAEITLHELAKILLKCSSGLNTTSNVLQPKLV